MKRCKKKNCITICIVILLCLNLLNSLQKIFDKDEFFYLKKFYKFDHESLTVNLTLKKQIESKLIDSIKPITTNANRPQTTSDKKADKYLLKISQERLNRLFKKLHSKELEYGEILDKLDLLSFENLITENDLRNATRKKIRYGSEFKKYLKVINQKEVVATSEFINYLTGLSEENSFLKPRTNMKPAKITDETKKPVLVTAANSDYFQALQSTVHYIHVYFPRNQLIVYDLGLSSDQLDLTVKNCKCVVKKFNQNDTYSSVSPVVKSLKKFSWKPIIIQETLKEFETVLYVDSSIRFKSSDIKSIVDACETVGMLTQFIGFDLICYTRMTQFEWFGEQWKTYENFFTIEANILMFHRNFLSSLIMKAWVTCALDESCIAPVEMLPAQPCYTSHRFDQDALTIISSFFYGHPTRKKEFLPAYSFTTNESYFFEVKRYEGFTIWS